MQRLPVSMLGATRPGEPLSSLFKLVLSAAACSDVACMSTLADLGAAAASAPAVSRIASGNTEPALRNMAVGVRGIRTAAAAFPLSCSAACLAATSPSIGRQCFATAAQQATKSQQQEGVARSVALRDMCLVNVCS